LGVPAELSELIILRPFTGSGSIAILNDIYAQYGVDSYVGRCASVIMGVSETVFYIAGVYFAKTEIKKLGCAIPVALVCSFIGCILACLFCRIM
ncbi:MAG: spore maturation protein, partial [Clostridia bacterium]|nr:spore maturation protein [Clostridia bacterium]